MNDQGDKVEREKCEWNRKILTLSTLGLRIKFILKIFNVLFFIIFCKLER